MCFRTEAESFGIAGLEDEGEDGHDREEAAGQDQVDDVVERLAAQSERERDARVRNVATVIPDLRLFRRHLYIHNTTVRKPICRRPLKRSMISADSAPVGPVGNESVPTIIINIRINLFLTLQSAFC